MATPDFAALLAKLADLSPDEISSLETDLVSAFDKADADGESKALLEYVDMIDQVRGEKVRRSDAPAPAVVEEPAPEPVVTPEPVVVEAVADEAPVAAPVVETPTTVTETDVPAAIEVQEGTPVAAAASSTVAVPRGSEPVVASAASRVFAGADIPGFGAGTEFLNSDDFGKAFAARIQTMNRLSGGDGEQVLIASIRTDAPADRTLSSNDPMTNMEKIEAVTHPDALVAAGGCCAPLVTRYDLFDCGGDSSRPVRDALAGFRADRGGIRFWRGPALADVNGALGFWTCADDAAADINTPSTWKVCARIECPPEETAELQAITMCLTFGVLQTRVFPELAVANNKLAMVAQARLADSALLAQIKAGSTRLTDAGTPLSAVRDLLSTIGRAAYYYRDRYRIKNAPLRAILPSWVIEVLRGDVILGPTEGRTPSDFFGISDDEIQSFFSKRGLNVTWAMDSAVPALHGGGFLDPISWTPGSVSPAVTEIPGTLPAWPTSVEWCLFVEGTWLFLDGGSLDLGIVRDSGLVRTNDYMEFSETFEAAANIGCESLWITSTISVNGKAQGPVAG